MADCLWIVSGWVLAAVLLRPFQDLPFLDDWTYAWSVEQLLKKGELRILDWSASPNFVQVLWGALFCLPFGFSFSALRVSTAVLAVWGLCSFYLLLRELGLGRREALVGTATLGLNPVFFVLSWTFMTDVPFVAVMMASTLAMMSALRRQSIGGLVTAEVLACLGLGIRTAGLAIPAAIGASLILRDGIAKRGREVFVVTVAVPILFLVVLLGFTLNHTEKVVDLLAVAGSPANRLRFLGRAIALVPEFSFAEVVAVTSFLGEALLPLTIACITCALLPRAALFCSMLATFFAITYELGERLVIPLSADSTWSLTELGATAQLVPGFEPPTLPLWLPWVVSGIAIGSFSIFLTRVSTVRRLDDGEIFITCLAAAHLLLIAILWLTYDRYLLVLLPLAIALLLRATPNIRTASVSFVLIVFGIISTIGLRDHLSYNRTLWRGVDALRSLGARDSEIDGGYMVNGWLQYAHPEHAQRDAQGKIFVPWINDARSLRYRISNRPLQGWMVLAELSYTRWLGRSGKIYVLENPDTDLRHSG